MPRPPSRTLAQLEQVYVENRAAWRLWLVTNCARSPGIWLVFDKKAARPDRLAYGDAVEEALCHGWIDSTVRSIDDARYVQLFTPRKPKSTWSRANKVRVARLIEEGLMAAAGLAAIERAKENGSWTSLDAAEALVVPEDLAAALASRKGASANFSAFAPSARKGYLHWISQAVRPETRAERVARVAALAASNQRSRHLEPPPPVTGTRASSEAKTAKGKTAKAKTPKAKTSKAKTSRANTSKTRSSKPATAKKTVKRAATRASSGSTRRAR
jgi:uncharacterized protein YdeI (YjbR/CyaY-like superfamily)